MRTVPYPKEAESIEIELPQPYTIESEAKVIVWLATLKTGAVLEIGCANGYLTKAFAKAVAPRTVYAVDWSHNPNLTVHQQAEMPDIVASRAKHLPNVIAIDGDSKRLEYPPDVGFILIDGDHTDDGVTQDTDSAMRHLRDFGRTMTVWHDYRPEAQWMGVARLLDRLSNEGLGLVQIEGTPIVVLGGPW